MIAWHDQVTLQKPSPEPAFKDLQHNIALLAYSGLNILFKLCFIAKLLKDRKKGFYSETTWAVVIAQLTNHEVQGGGKNPETGGRGIFAPTADRVVI